ncbi:MAG: ATP-binding protein [Pseudanabaenaceae cyanobacterium bins.68]|nr:ATP-binding protein [Pseudanabaenaceae cyanobacterium bins.68]
MEEVPTFEFRTGESLQGLDAVIDWFRHLDLPPHPPQVWLECQTILAEAFTNAVRHGNLGAVDLPPVLIQVFFYPDYLELRVWDSGAGFNLASQLTKLEQMTDQYAAHGRGIGLIQTLCDRVSYQTLGDRHNYLVMYKSYVPKLA